MPRQRDNVPQSVREAIAVALMVSAVTATAAALLREPLFIPGGFVLFLIFYIWRINPKIKAAYQEEESIATYSADDETYQPILDRFSDDADDAALVEGYRAWAQGPHDNITRLRFFQQAILQMIDVGKIYRVEELMVEIERISAEEELTERFETFRSYCDGRISEFAQSRLAISADLSRSAELANSDLPESMPISTERDCLAGKEELYGNR